MGYGVGFGMLHSVDWEEVMSLKKNIIFMLIWKSKNHVEKKYLKKHSCYIHTFPKIWKWKLQRINTVKPKLRKLIDPKTMCQREHLQEPARNDMLQYYIDETKTSGKTQWSHCTSVWITEKISDALATLTGQFKSGQSSLRAFWDMDRDEVKDFKINNNRSQMKMITTFNLILQKMILKITATLRAPSSNQLF